MHALWNATGSATITGIRDTINYHRPPGRATCTTVSKRCRHSVNDLPQFATWIVSWLRPGPP
jgi:hypothetical protein